MDFSILKRTVGTSQLFTLLGILERTRGWWSVLGKLMNSITLLSKNIFHILNSSLRLWFAGGGLYIFDSITYRAAKDPWENLSW